MKAANVNKANINSVIRFGNETSTDPITGHIQITKDKRVKFQVIKLTHELTNRANKAKLAKATNDVANKKISPEVYAKKIMEIELDGQINQIKVAADIGFQYPGEENKRINSLTKVSHPLKHCLFSFPFACRPPYPLTFNTCLTEVM